MKWGRTTTAVQRAALLRRVEELHGERRNDLAACLGIHGQMLYVNPSTGVVAATLSSWPDPKHAWKLFATLRVFDATSTQLV